MRQSTYALAAILSISIGAVCADAALIASESFQTTDSGAGGTYDADNGLGYSPNTGVLMGNYGFASSAGKTWVNNTMAAVANLTGLSHSLTTGTPKTGAVRIGNLSSGIARRVFRTFAAEPPLSNEYYFGGLVNMGALENLVGVTQSMAGITTSTGTTVDTFNIGVGIHYGVRKDATGAYLTTAAGGVFRDLLQITSPSTTYQVVLRISAATSGNEFLSAWYAPDGATELTQGFMGVDVGNIFTSAANLGSLTLQTRNQSGGSNANKWISFDELRFGTTAADVTAASAVPEPAGAAACAGALAAFAACLRRRRRA